MSSIRYVQLAADETQYDPAILRLIDDYAQIDIIHGKPLPPAVLDAMLPGLRQHGGMIFVALDADSPEPQPVGVATCFRGYSTFYARRLINVHDLVVAAEWQGRGIGSGLLSAIEDVARSEGCCKVTLEVSAQNPRAHALYRRCGFDRQADGSESPPSYFLQKLLPPIEP